MNRTPSPQALATRLRRAGRTLDDAVTANDKLIWDLSTGTRITAVKDLVMEGSSEVAFKAGTTYCVNSLHPIAAPAFIVVTNDQGQPHRLEGSDVRAYFKR